ncbi:MAG: arginase family protein [Bilophila wadsworthia]
MDIIPGYLDESFERIEAAVAGVLDAGAVPVIMGGDHSITLPELRAVAKRHGPVALLHFDAHSDTGDDFFGKPYNHGTTFHWAIEEGLILPEQSTQAGIRGPLYSRSSLTTPAGMRVIMVNCTTSVDETIRIMRERIRPGTPVFVTFDIDFDAAGAPGTGTPEMRFTTHEASLILGVPRQRLVGMDLRKSFRYRPGDHLVRRGGDHASRLAANKKHNPS